MDHGHDTDFSKLVNLYPVKILSLISTPAFSLNAFVDKACQKFHVILSKKTTVYNEKLNMVIEESSIFSLKKILREHLIHDRKTSHNDLKLMLAWKTRNLAQSKNIF